MKRCAAIALIVAMLTPSAAYAYTGSWDLMVPGWSWVNKGGSYADVAQLAVRDWPSSSVDGLKVRRYEANGPGVPTCTAQNLYSSCNTTGTPWYCTFAHWAFVGDFVGAWYYIPTGGSPVMGTGYIACETGGDFPRETQWSWGGIATEPYCDGRGSDTWRPRDVYPGGAHLWDVQPGMYGVIKASSIVAMGGRNTDGTYWWRAKVGYGHTSYTAAVLTTQTIEVTHSITPTNIMPEMVGAIGADPKTKVGNVYIGGFNGTAFKTTPAGVHRDLTTLNLDGGGTTDPAEVAHIAELWPTLDQSIEETTPPSSGTISGWSDAALSAVANSVGVLSGSVTSWFWPITQIGGW